MTREQTEKIIDIYNKIRMKKDAIDAAAELLGSGGTHMELLDDIQDDIESLFDVEDVYIKLITKDVDGLIEYEFH